MTVLVVISRCQVKNKTKKKKKKKIKINGLEDQKSFIPSIGIP